MIRITGSTNVSIVDNNLFFTGSDTNTTGILANTAMVDISSNSIKGFMNGIEYYDSTSLTSDVETNLLDSNKFGLVVSRAVHPYYDSNSIQPDLIDLQISCNKFYKNDVGIFGSGELIQQGDPNSDAANDFNNNTQWNMLWQNDPPVNYFFDMNYSNRTNPLYISGNSYLMNGQIQSSSDVQIDSLLPASTCYGSWIFMNNISLSNVNVLVSDGIVKIFPNPSNNKLMFEFNENEKRKMNILVYDMYGKVIFNKNVDRNSFAIPTGKWAKGIYLIKIDTGNKKINPVYKLFKM